MSDPSGYIERSVRQNADAIRDLDVRVSETRENYAREMGEIKGQLRTISGSVDELKSSLSEHREGESKVAAAAIEAASAAREASEAMKAFTGASGGVSSSASKERGEVRVSWLGLSVFGKGDQATSVLLVIVGAIAFSALGYFAAHPNLFGG